MPMSGHDPAAHAIFDGLYEFAKANPSPGDPRLMNRKVPPDSGNSGSSAFDGDADIASWSTIATRAAAAAQFQTGTAGVSILSQAKPVQIRDTTAAPGSGFFYRLRIGN